MKRLILFTYCLCFSSYFVAAQVKIASGTTINSSKNTMLSTGMTIENSSSEVVLPLVVLLNPGTTISTTEDLQIIGGLDFSSGVISFNGNIYYSGGGENLFYDDQNYLLNTSWNNFYAVGSGLQKYPLGTSAELADMFMNINSHDTTQVEVIQGDPGIELSSVPSVHKASENWYWHYYGNFGGTPSLSINSPDDILLNSSNPNEALVALSFYEDRSTVKNLSRGSGSSANYVKAASADPGPFFALGVSIDVVPIIHQIITPNRDGVNDVLEIENLDVYAGDYEIMLIDRLGAVVWRSKRLHENNMNFEFLEPGNYVCILRYSGREAKQMVTVLK